MVRAAAITEAVPIWHLDTPEFLNCQDIVTSERLRSEDIFPQVLIHDEFMRRVLAKEEWTLIDPKEVEDKLGIKIYECFGKKFDEAYKVIEANLDTKIKLYKKVKAVSLLKSIMERQLETGLPYVIFIDTINEFNTCPHVGNVEQANLCCVGGDTKILTDKGRIPIVDLVGQPTNIWNGFEWSEVTPIQTNPNQKLVKVKLTLYFSDDNGGVAVNKELWCTDYHKWVLDKGNGVLEEVETKDLKPEDKTLDYTIKDHRVYGRIKSISEEIYAPTYCFNEPKRHLGVFNDICTGQCEDFSVTLPDELIHVCNLLSINAARVSKEDLKYYVPLAVRILDNAIEMTTEPIPEAARHNQMFRTLGVGMMGLADRLALSNLNYTSPGTKKFVADYAEEFSYWAHTATIQLGKDRGNFEAFEGSEQSKGFILGKVFCGNRYVLKSDFLEYFDYSEETLLEVMSNNKDLLHHFTELEQGELVKVVNHNWQDLVKEIKIYCRNALLTNIPPNTNTSIIMGSTASFLPVFSKIFIDKAGDGGKTIVPPYLKEKFWFYQEQPRINPNVIVDLVGQSLQPWICKGISAELMLNTNEDSGYFDQGPNKAKFLYDLIVSAWKQKLKTIYYIRSVGVKEKDAGCVSCAN